MAPYFKLAVRVDVAPEWEIGPQLLNIGIDAKDVRKVILTHLHTDHAGGLHHFPNSEILVCEKELRFAMGYAGRLRGYLPNRWPSWFAPKPIPFQQSAFGPFGVTCPVTSKGDISIVPSHGHTHGHISVIVVDRNVSYFIAGDTTYTQQALLERAVDGVSPDKAQAIRTLDRIIAYARRHPTVYLPSHDPDSLERLSTCDIITIAS